MLFSCTETSLDVKVACEQIWGKQLLLPILWTGTRKQEGFDFILFFFCGEEALRELWLV